MYALKARDKLHKMEKERDKEMAKGGESRAREVNRHHRGERKQPATSKREAKVCVCVHVIVCCHPNQYLCLCDELCVQKRVEGGGGG